MLEKLQEKLGTAGLIVAVVALVAALGGAAVAAAPKLSSTQKKEVKKIAKKYAGKPGATGTQGPAGANGKDGAPGAPGATGPRGAQGQPGEDGSDGACSAANPECVLPAGATETGDWAINAKGVYGTFLTISFPMRVEPQPIVEWVPSGTTTSHCEGTPADPTAAPGFLCVYATGNLTNVKNNEPVDTGYTADKTSGFVYEFELENEEAEAYGSGSWAVTR